MSPGNDGLVRPFLNQAPPGPTPNGMSDPVDVPVVRAYMMTKGRVAVAGEALPFETMLSLSELGERRQSELLFEQAKIAVLVSAESMSIAEISAKLRIPVGTAQVLCGDMVSDQLLEPHKAATNASIDISLLTRLINGVRAL